MKKAPTSNKGKDVNAGAKNDSKLNVDLFVCKVKKKEVNHGSFQTNLSQPNTGRGKNPQTQRQEVYQLERP